MPNKMDRKLIAEARTKFPGNKTRQNRYRFGTLWKIAREKYPHNKAKQYQFVTHRKAKKRR
jgi:hypothetical protein